MQHLEVVADRRLGQLERNPGQGGTLNHLGIEVPDTDAVDAVQARLTGTGLASADERDTTCCYARQDKFWVEGVPDGASWEVYMVLDDSQTFYSEDESGPGCCAAAEAEGSEPARRERPRLSAASGLAVPPARPGHRCGPADHPPGPGSFPQRPPMTGRDLSPSGPRAGHGR